MLIYTSQSIHYHTSYTVYIPHSHRCLSVNVSYISQRIQPIPPTAQTYPLPHIILIYHIPCKGSLYATSLCKFTLYPQYCINIHIVVIHLISSHPSIFLILAILGDQNELFNANKAATFHGIKVPYISQLAKYTLFL